MNHLSDFFTPKNLFANPKWDSYVGIANPGVDQPTTSVAELKQDDVFNISVVHTLDDLVELKEEPAKYCP